MYKKLNRCIDHTCSGAFYQYWCQKEVLDHLLHAIRQSWLEGGRTLHRRPALKLWWWWCRWWWKCWLLLIRSRRVPQINCRYLWNSVMFWQNFVIFCTLETLTNKRSQFLGYIWQRKNPRLSHCSCSLFQLFVVMHIVIFCLQVQVALHIAIVFIYWFIYSTSNQKSISISFT